MASLIVAIAFIVIGVFLTIRIILPREVWTEVFAEIIHDALQGLWRLVFGPRKVHIARRKKRSKLLGGKKRHRQ